VTENAVATSEPPRPVGRLANMKEVEEM